jgi:3-oxoacyl-[acyl-carrier protein] reductase
MLKEDFMDLGIKGKRALIGGGTRGIGRAVAEALASEGVNLEIVARHESEKVAEALAKKYEVEAKGHNTDLSRADDIKRLRETVGEVDILFINTGGPKPGEIEDLKDEDWINACNLTLMSAVRLVNAFLDPMLERGWGRVVASTSISVFEPIPRLLLSNSIRMSVEGLMKSLSIEHASSGVTFNCIAPGYTLTERVKQLFEDMAKSQKRSFEEVEMAIAEKTDVKRLARPDEIANAVAFLASEKASYITGVTLRVDGGFVKSL